MAGIEALVAKIEQSDELKTQVDTLWKTFVQRAEGADKDEVARARAEYYNGLVTIGKGQGLDFSVDDAERYIDAVIAQATAKEQGELSDDDLAAVAGGANSMTKADLVASSRLLFGGSTSLEDSLKSLYDGTKAAGDYGKSVLL